MRNCCAMNALCFRDMNLVLSVPYPVIFSVLVISYGEERCRGFVRFLSPAAVVGVD